MSEKLSDNKVTITMEDTGSHVIVDINGTIPDDSMVLGVASLAHSVLIETETPLPVFISHVLAADVGANISGSVVHLPYIEPEGEKEGANDEP
jgi:hypothetical protein